MSILNETCDGSVATQNTGGKKQCTPKPLRAYALAKKGFSFATLAEAKLKSSWDTAKQNKNIVVFWDVEEGPTQNNIEATKKEGRFRDYLLKEGVRGFKIKHYIGDRAFEALKTYNNSLEYIRIFEILGDGTFTCDLQDDGTIKGELLVSFNVGVLNDTTDETPQNCEVDIKFSSDTKSVIAPSFDLEDYEGIYDVDLTIISSSANQLVVKAESEGSSVASLVQADWQFTEADGADEPVTGSSYDSTTGEYTLTGVAFVTGVLGTAGVIAKTDFMYEAINVAVTI